ncbi:MAG: hypothetical protein HY544_01945 [Candidatus Diapherotrites archaeon]|uniref:Uncharacterized protein n=1 Tax=Candidatus Iainarchaeum sp. TaxID=3101447 RepID=A0A8T3YMG6_9ARCH|nr:hypothetical protein [Candidatus Diapherotrites archaeon]
MGNSARFSAWMFGRGSPGHITNLNKVQKGPDFQSAVERTRAALKDRIDSDLNSGNNVINSHRYSGLSGYSRRLIINLAQARRQEKGITERVPRGGPRFSFPDILRQIARKHIKKSRKSGNNSVSVKEIVSEFAASSGLVVLPTSLYYVIKSIDPEIAVSLAGCKQLVKSLIATKGYKEYRVFKPRKK